MDATQDADAKTAYGVSFGSSCWPQQNDSGCSADAVITQMGQAVKVCPFLRRRENIMIELVNTAPVTVPVGQSIPFSIVATKGGCAERHRAGSAQVTLAKPGRYLVTFSGNVAVPTGETAGEVALGIARDGEILGGTVMRATPAAVEQYFNVSSQTYVDVFCGCCENVSVKNAGTIPVLVDNPNITAVRVCG